MTRQDIEDAVAVGRFEKGAQGGLKGAGEATDSGERAGFARHATNHREIRLGGPEHFTQGDLPRWARQGQPTASAAAWPDQSGASQPGGDLHEMAARNAIGGGRLRNGRPLVGMGGHEEQKPQGQIREMGETQPDFLPCKARRPQGPPRQAIDAGFRAQRHRAGARRWGRV